LLKRKINSGYQKVRSMDDQAVYKSSLLYLQQPGSG